MSSSYFLGIATGTAVTAAAVYYYVRTPKKSKLTLGYWDIRGLAAPARMLLAFAKAEGKIGDFEDVTFGLADKPGGGYDGSAWTVDAKPTLREKNALINLPYVIDHDTGLVVTQSTCVYQYIGRCAGMMGKTDAEVAECEQALAQAFDLRNEVVKFVYPFGGVTAATYPEALEKHLSGSAKQHLEKFEAFLGNKTFMAGASVTAGDFHVFEMLDQHEMMASAAGKSSPLAAFPKLQGFYGRIKALPQLADYFASAAYKLPVNNKMALFK